jgi:hypothetical protein
VGRAATLGRATAGEEPVAAVAILAETALASPVRGGRVADSS